MLKSIAGALAFLVAGSAANAERVSDRQYFGELVNEYADDVQSCGVSFASPRLVAGNELLYAAYRPRENVVAIAFWESQPERARQWFAQRDRPARGRFASAQAERQRAMLFTIAHEMSHAVQWQAGAGQAMLPIHFEMGANRLALDWLRLKRHDDAEAIVRDTIDIWGFQGANEPDLTNLDNLRWFNENYTQMNRPPTTPEEGVRYGMFHVAMMRYVLRTPMSGSFCERARRIYDYGRAINARSSVQQR